MNLHFRSGLEREGFEFLKSYKIKKAIFHNYSGPPEMIKEINDYGYYYSYGAANYDVIGEKRGKWIKERLDLIHDDLLILEIDVLSDKNFRPPSKVFPHILNAIAVMKNTTPEEIEALNQRNVLRLIGNDPKLVEMRKLLS